MLFKALVITLPVTLGLMACAPNTGCERPFSHGWVREIKSEQELNRRKERIGPAGLPLFGNSEKTNAGIRVDESGKPSLGFGKDTGWSAEIDYRSGPEPKLKYRKEWDFHKPQRERAPRN